jgi:hypothetical protein
MSHLKFLAFLENNDSTTEIFDSYYNRINRGEWMSATTERGDADDDLRFSYFLVRSIANNDHFAVVTCIENYDATTGFRVGKQRTTYDSIRIFHSENDAIKFMELAAKHSIPPRAPIGA